MLARDLERVERGAPALDLDDSDTLAPPP